MRQNKISILLPYYNRPNMVRFALTSLYNQNYSNWELLFCDDGSLYSAEKIVQEYFPNDPRVTYINTKTSLEEKKQTGSVFGKYLNEFILNSDSDLCLTLCDDDALCKNYLINLNNWYNKNSYKNYSFCDVVPYDPFTIKSLDDIDENSESTLNSNGELEVIPQNRLDSSQVSWRTNVFKEQYVRYPYPKTSSLDSVLFQQLYNLFGLCPFNGIIGQYKGYHNDQLIHKSNPNSNLDKYQVNDFII